MKKFFFLAVFAAVLCVMLNRCSSSKMSAEVKTADLNNALLETLNEKEINALIKKGADVNASNKFGTALNTNSYVGNENAVKRLLKAGATPNSLDSINGSTPIFDASTPKIAQALIEAGADVNFQRKSDGKTPLMWHIICVQPVWV